MDRPVLIGDVYFLMCKCKKDVPLEICNVGRDNLCVNW
jgi:hypothetical protein